MGNLADTRSSPVNRKIYYPTGERNYQNYTSVHLLIFHMKTVSTFLTQEIPLFFIPICTNISHFDRNTVHIFDTIYFYDAIFCYENIIKWITLKVFYKHKKSLKML